MTQPRPNKAHRELVKILRREKVEDWHINARGTRHRKLYIGGKMIMVFSNCTTQGISEMHILKMLRKVELDANPKRPV